MKESQKAISEYFATISATTGFVAMGSILGYSSPAGAILTNNSTDSSFHLTSFQNSWFTSVCNIGAMIGCPIAVFSTFILGRRGTIICSAIPVLIGWIIIVFAQNFEMLLIGRFLTGIYCSLISTAVPTYIAEFSSRKSQARLGIFFQIMISFGIIITYGVGVWLHNFRWNAAVCAVLPCLCSLLMIPNKESPLYLLSKGRDGKAKEALQYFRGQNFESTEIEFQQMKMFLEEYKNRRVGFSSFGRRSVLKPFLISLGLIFFQQFSGVSVLTFNFSNIFQGVSESYSGGGISVLVTIIQLCSLLVGSMYVDKTGRKFLLSLSALFMFIFLFFLAAYFYYQENNIEFANKVRWLPVLSAIVFLMAFYNGYGPIPWLMIGELFSPEIKEIARSIFQFCNWTFAFIVTFAFGPLKNEVHTYGVLWIFAGVCFLNLIFVFSCVYETRGRTLQEINVHFGGIYFNVKQHEEK